MDTCHGCCVTLGTFYASLCLRIPLRPGICSSLVLHFSLVEGTAGDGGENFTPKGPRPPGTPCAETHSEGQGPQIPTEGHQRELAGGGREVTAWPRRTASAAGLGPPDRAGHMRSEPSPPDPGLPEWGRSSPVCPTLSRRAGPGAPGTTVNLLTGQHHPGTVPRPHCQQPGALSGYPNLRRRRCCVL